MIEHPWARPVVFFEIRGKDSKALQSFYATLFGWKIDANNPLSIGVVEPGVGGPVEGVGGVITGSDEGHVLIYVQVANLNESLREAERLGGRAVLEPTDIPNGPTIAQLADPEGNLIGLVQQ
jgi:hypothetical protein